MMTVAVLIWMMGLPRFGLLDKTDVNFRSLPRAVISQESSSFGKPA